MKERRHFKRIKIKLPVKIRIFEKKIGFITPEIEACCESLSRTGLSFTIPLSWDCPDCNKCLGWIYNLNCKLKNKDNQADIRYFAPNLDFKIYFFGLPPANRPLTVEARCVWVKEIFLAHEKYYSVGAGISGLHRARIAAYLVKLAAGSKKIH